VIERVAGELKTLFMLGTFTGFRLADAATIQAHKAELLAHLERELAAATWFDAQPRDVRAAISRTAGAHARRTAAPAGEARLLAIEAARARAKT
jgi:hypothetical protein